MRESYDVAVIGAGHNGLTCAAYLARRGLSTVVLEARDAVGGCASTVEAIGARVNICNCDHVMVRATPLIGELDLARHGLRYLEVDPAFLHLTWDGDPPWFLYRNADRTVAELARQRPADAAAYRRYLAAALPAARLIARLAGAQPTPRAVLPAALASGGRAGWTIWRWCERSALDVLSDFFGSERMITPALTTGPAVWGVPVDAGGTGLAALGYALRHVVGVGRPVGGSGALTDALRSAVEAAGGRVRCSTPATRVTATGSGFEIATAGASLAAARVVAAIDPRTVFADLLDQPAPSEPEPEGFESKVDAVMNRLPEYRALAGAHLSGEQAAIPTAVVSPRLDEMRQAAELHTQGKVAPRPMLLVNIPSVLDPSMRSEAGSHVLSLEVLWTPYSLEGGWATSDEPRRWLERFSTLVQPDFLDGITSWRAMTPPDYERQFGLRKGYAPSYPGSPFDALRGRPRHLARYRTDVPGLYLTGAATYPGAGIWGASGRNAAMTVLADANR